ncbi:MAG: GNAT family N-acetyltransferase [Phycisphaerales bacterium]|nr:GNAT family N-acetyltransferase [Phycisphaerales bacterium]
MITSPPTVLRIGPCSLTDARALLARHYAPGMPARVCLMLGAWLDAGTADWPQEAHPTLVGVLTVSHPTLNDRWRALAWPGVFDMRDKRERAHKLNAEVRRISRVVVLPRFRGMGIATALVRAYLRRPLTKRTEVIAAMGEWCRCFEQAGMRAVECSPIERDVKLAAALKQLRIAPELLADEHVVQVLVRDESFVKAIRAWANAAGATRKVLRRPEAIEALAPIAARAVVGIREPARVWVSGGGECGMKGEGGAMSVAWAETETPSGRMRGHLPLWERGRTKGKTASASSGLSRSGVKRASLMAEREVTR